jgi:hypothetical protein
MVWSQIQETMNCSMSMIPAGRDHKHCMNMRSQVRESGAVCVIPSTLTPLSLTSVEETTHRSVRFLI